MECAYNRSRENYCNLFMADLRELEHTKYNIQAHIESLQTKPLRTDDKAALEVLKSLIINLDHWLALCHRAIKPKSG